MAHPPRPAADGGSHGERTGQQDTLPPPPAAPLRVLHPQGWGAAAAWALWLALRAGPVAQCVLRCPMLCAGVCRSQDDISHLVAACTGLHTCRALTVRTTDQKCCCRAPAWSAARLRGLRRAAGPRLFSFFFGQMGGCRRRGVPQRQPGQPGSSCLAPAAALPPIPCALHTRRPMA
jgi:hypothetical protein